MRKTTSIFVDKDIFEQYSIMCDKRGMKIGRSLENFMRRELGEGTHTQSQNNIDKIKEYLLEHNAGTPTTAGMEPGITKYGLEKYIYSACSVWDPRTINKYIDALLMDRFIEVDDNGIYNVLGV